MEKKNLVVGIGETLWDVLPNGSKIGGAPAGFAYYANRQGADALIVSAIGNDAFGEETEKAYKSMNLPYILPQLYYHTGTTRVNIDKEGISTYEIEQNTAWDHLPFTDKMKESARKAQAVYWGTLAQRTPQAKASILDFIKNTPEECMRIFDVNLRQNFYTKEMIEESLEVCNVLKMNDEELIVLSRLFGCSSMNMANRCWLILGRYNLDMIILTCGMNGSHVFSKGVMDSVEAPYVEVADTIGAGNAFVGTFCASILAGNTIHEAHEKAARISAYVCTQHGAIPCCPRTSTDISALTF